ncbi:MAG: DMT family transporter [Spirochaetales bacterium]|nr:DMT family transporter [Spirochaetales bacterium]
MSTPIEQFPPGGKVIPNRKKVLLADGVILLSALIWGGDYIFAKNLLETITPGRLNALRFSVCAVILLFVAFKKLKQVPVREIAGCLLTGFCMFGGFFFQTGGLRLTSIGNNAFIVSSYVIFVPFVLWMLQRQRPGIGAFLSALVCVSGIALLTLNRATKPNLGDVMTLISAVCFAFEIVLIGIFARRVDPVVLAFLEACVVAVCFNIYAAFAEPPIPRLDGGMIGSLIYLTFLGATATHIMVTLAMKHTSSVHASIICSLESVFGLLMAVLFLGETVQWKQAFGCVLVFLAVLFTELWDQIVPAKTRTSSV